MGSALTSLPLFVLAAIFKALECSSCQEVKEFKTSSLTSAWGSTEVGKGVCGLSRS